MTYDINHLLKRVISAKASDLHLAVDTPPIIRIQGRLQPLTDLPPLTEQDLEKILKDLINPQMSESFYRRQELDASYQANGVGRFRINASFQRGSISISIRPVPDSIPSFEQLGLPPVYKELITRPNGLVLVAGPAGSGKSTSLAAMIDHLNQTQRKRIITIEDPIEFVHENKKCMIVQREVAVDTSSFAAGLRHALRQDPDVIMIGELRDLETISTALTAAETGHLVVGTVHAVGAIQAIERLIEIFPAENQHGVRYQLSMVLQGILYQVLIPRSRGEGRVLAIEVLVGTISVRNLIRSNQLHLLNSYLYTGAKERMQTLEQSLANLVKTGEIDPDAAMARARDRRSLEILLK